MKRFLQKSLFRLHSLLLLVVMSVVGINSAWAEDWQIVYQNSADNDDGIKYIDANNDGSQWQLQVNYFMYRYNSSNSANDYLVLPVQNLEEGKNYRFSVVASNSSTWYYEKYEVVYGTSQSNASAFTNIIISEQELKDGNRHRATETFSVASSGNYYIAIHATSIPDRADLSIFEMLLEVDVDSGNVPDETTYTINFVNAPDEAYITLNGETINKVNSGYTIAKNLNAESVTYVYEPSGYYADVTYDSATHTFTVTYVEGGRVEFSNSWAQSDGITYDPYWSGGTVFNVDSWDGSGGYGRVYFRSETKKINKIELLFDGEASSICDGKGFGSVTSNGNIAIWTAPAEGNENDICIYSTSTDDRHVVSSKVYYEPLPEIEYPVVITSADDLPADFTPYVIVDGQEFNASGTYRTPKTLNKNNVYAETPNEDWYYEVDYVEGTHTFTVTYKEYLHYIVSVEGCSEETAGVKVAGNYQAYKNDAKINVKEELIAANLTVVEVNGYVAGNPIVSALEGHNATITVPYTEADIIPYTVTITGMPDGAKVMIENEEFIASGTHNSRKTLRSSDAQVLNCPATHYTNEQWEWYDEDTQTFTIAFTPYLAYTVAVAGASAYKDADAGVKVKTNGNTYHVGEPIYVKSDLTEDNVEAAEVDGYTGTVSFSDNVFTVSYTKNDYVQFKAGYYNLYSYGNVNDTKEGVSLETYETYSYGPNGNEQVFSVNDKSSNHIILTSTGSPIVKVELVYLWSDGDRITSWNVGSMNSDNSVWQGKTNNLEIWDYNNRSTAVKSIKVWLAQPTPAPGFPEEDVAYEISLPNSDYYVNLQSSTGEAAILSETKERIYFVWDEMNAGFSIKDANGNYIGKYNSYYGLSSSEGEYWTVEDLNDGTYAFKNSSNQYLYFQRKYSGSNAVCDNNPSSNYAFVIAEFNDSRANVMTLTPMMAEGEVEAITGPLTFSTDFFTEEDHSEGVPNGMTITDADSNEYTITKVYWSARGSNIYVYLENPITAAGTYTLTIPEGAIPCIGYKANKAMEFTWEIKDYTYDIVVTKDGQPSDYTIDVNGTDYDTEVTVKHLLTEDDVNASEGTSGCVFEIIEIVDPTDDQNGTITVAYTTIPTLAISSQAVDNEGNHWTTFSFKYPVAIAAGYTPYIVTGVADGKLDIVELEGNVGDVSDYPAVGPSSIAGGYNQTISRGDEFPVITSDTYFNNDSNSEILVSSADFTITITAPLGYVIDGVYPQSLNADCGIEFPNGQKGKSIVARCFNKNGEGWWRIGSFSFGIAPLSAPVIPANTGILVKGSVNGNIAYEVKSKDAETVDVTGNLLQASGDGFTMTEADPANLYYKLTLNADSEEGSLAFYWDKNSEMGHKINMSANKAYLVLDANQTSSNRMLISGGYDEKPTAIDSVVGISADAPVYNLQGQRVNVTKAGVYVKNGKKFIVK